VEGQSVGLVRVGRWGSQTPWYAGRLRRRVTDVASSSVSSIVTVVTEPRFAGRRLGQIPLAGAKRQGVRLGAIASLGTHDPMRRRPAQPP
jgi:hypothetical protein